MTYMCIFSECSASTERNAVFKIHHCHALFSSYREFISYKKKKLFQQNNFRIMSNLNNFQLIVSYYYFVLSANSSRFASSQLGAKPHSRLRSVSSSHK